MIKFGVSSCSFKLWLKKSHSSQIEEWKKFLCFRFFSELLMMNQQFGSNLQKWLHFKRIKIYLDVTQILKWGDKNWEYFLSESQDILKAAKSQKLFTFLTKPTKILSRLSQLKYWHPKFLLFHLQKCLPKVFWPTARKNCSSDREKLLKCEAEGREFAKFKQWKVRTIFGNRMLF